MMGMLFGLQTFWRGRSVCGQVFNSNSCLVRNQQRWRSSRWTDICEIWSKVRLDELVEAGETMIYAHVYFLIGLRRLFYRKDRKRSLWWQFPRVEGRWKSINVSARLSCFRWKGHRSFALLPIWFTWIHKSIARSLHGMDMLCTPVSCRLFDVLIYFIIVIPMAYMQSHIHSAWSCPVFVDVSWRSDDTWSPPRQNPAKELMARAS